MDGKRFVMTVETLIAQNPLITLENLYKAQIVTSSLMSQYRTGRVKKAGMRIVRRTAYFFKIDVEDFVNYLDTLPNPSENKKIPVQADSPDGDLENLIRRLLRLPPEQRKLVSDLVDNLAK